MDIQSHTPAFRRGYRLQWEASQQGHVILYPEGMATLNPAAAAILQLVDGQRTVRQIITALQAQYPDAHGLDQDVLAFFPRVVNEKWVILCADN